MAKKNEAQKLTPRRKRFCEEFVKDFNGYAAAVRAGYSEKSARSMSSQLLTFPNIQNYISSLNKKVADRNAATIDRAIEEAARIAFFDPKGLFDEDGEIKSIPDMDEDIRRAIVAVDGADFTKIKLANKLDALEKILRYLGAYEKDNAQKITQITVKVEE